MYHFWAAEAFLPLFVFLSMPKQLPNANKRTSNKRSFQTYVHRNQRVRIPDDYMAVGLITSSHGLRGEVKVELHTDFPERFAPDTVVYLGEELEEAVIREVRPHQGQLLLKFQEIDDRTKADALRGLWILIHEDEAVELEEDTYFVHDIIGLAVQTTKGEPLGTVEEVLFTGANDVYVVKNPGEASRELLLPAIEEVVKEIDLENGLMIVELLPGLLDE
jgi:16S rRNA processing protein RimM